jgi:hypothetical protein
MTCAGVSRRFRPQERATPSPTTTPGSAVVFVYDLNDQLLGEYDANGAPPREYIWLDDVQVAMVVTDPLREMHQQVRANAGY